jgi:hypothetical protein
MSRVDGSAAPCANGVGAVGGWTQAGISPDPVDKSVDKILEKCVSNVEERGLDTLPIFYADAITA